MSLLVIPNSILKGCVFVFRRVATTFQTLIFVGRYWRSLTRAPEALRLAEKAIVLDNSGLHPVRMLWIERGRVTWQAEVLPEWAQRLATAL